jgi:F0F1-type ATP synthase beta subunit
MPGVDVRDTQRMRVVPEAMDFDRLHLDATTVLSRLIAELGTTIMIYPAAADSCCRSSWLDPLDSKLCTLDPLYRKDLAFEISSVSQLQMDSVSFH